MVALAHISLILYLTHISQAALEATSTGDRLRSAVLRLRELREQTPSGTYE